jgi:hypothetical protein
MAFVIYITDPSTDTINPIYIDALPASPSELQPYVFPSPRLLPTRTESTPISTTPRLRQAPTVRSAYAAGADVLRKHRH